MSKHLIFSTILLSALFSGCGSGNNNKTQRDSAMAMDSMIHSAMDNANYDRAVTLIDSFSAIYPLQADLRRSHIATRAKAVEGLTMQNIPSLDATIARLQASIAEQEKDFVSVKTSATLPPYLVYHESTGTVDGQRRIQARVNTGDDAAYSPWTLAVGTGTLTGINRLEIDTEQGAKYTIDVPVSDYAQSSVPMENVQALAQQLASGDAISTATAYGKNGNTTIKVSNGDSRGIAAAWKLCADRDSLRNTLIAREKAERLLQLSRDKAAN